MIFLLIPVFIFMILYEAPGLIKKRYWKELTVFSILISLAFFLSLMQILRIEIPNPVKDMQYFVKNLMHLSYD